MTYIKKHHLDKYNSNLKSLANDFMMKTDLITGLGSKEREKMKSWKFKF